MSEVKRSDQFVYVIESQVGQWVRFEDFDESERERRKLQDENLSLRGSCKALGERLTRAEENLKKARKERDKNHAKRCALRDEMAPLRAEVERLRIALSHADTWIEAAPHGENCFVSNHYDGDPGSRCNCGKDSTQDAIEAALRGDTVQVPAELTR